MGKVQLKKLLECKENFCFYFYIKIHFLIFFCAHRVGFKDTTTIERLCSAFPELDMVDHTHRKELVQYYLKVFFFDIYINIVLSDRVN